MMAEGEGHFNSADNGALFRILAETTSAAILIVQENKIRYANPTARMITGYSPEELQGMEFWQLAAPGYQEVIQKYGMGNPWAANIPIRYELKLLNRSGDERWVDITAAPISLAGEEAMLVTAFDITDRDMAEKALRLSKEEKEDQAKTERTIARAQMLAHLSQAFAEAGLHYPSVLNTIVQQISELSGDACIVYLLGEEGYTLEPAAFHHPNQEALESFRKISRSIRMRFDEGAVGSVFQTGEPLVMMDVPIDQMNRVVRSEYLPWLAQFPVRCGLFVPLRTQGRKLGVLNLLRYQAGESYSLEDQNFYQDLADRAALAIENARLYAQETSRARELEALHRATTAMLTTLDLDTLLSQILDAAQHAIPSAEQGTLHLIERQTGHLEVRAQSVFRDQRIHKVSLSRIEGHIARAVSEKKPLLIHDNLATPASSVEGETTGARSVRSAIIAPLLLGDHVLGVLSLIHSMPGQFTLADLRLLVSFAATATAAIQNATLYAEVQRLATTDTLTGLLNRRRFFELGGLEIDRFQRFGRPLSAIMLDVDNLKQTNDTYGHATGDRLLQSLADRCRANLRRVDILGRYGGDEFAILLPETGVDLAHDVAERIRQSLENDKIWTEQGLVTTSASLGVATAMPKTINLAELLARADTALYLAKQRGRNRVEIV